jgi:hypothetical protein
MVLAMRSDAARYQGIRSSQTQEDEVAERLSELAELLVMSPRGWLAAGDEGGGAGGGCA